MPTSDKLLILDLDSTLFYSSDELLDRSPEFEAFDYFVYIRPHARELVARCAELFTVAVWTTAVQEYAERMIEEIFPDDVALDFLWDRSQCARSFDYQVGSETYIKDLKKVVKQGWPIDRILIVDDTHGTARRNYGNLVPVEPYYGESGDDELRLLIDYLPILAACDEIRSLEKRGWQTNLRSSKE